MLPAGNLDRTVTFQRLPDPITGTRDTFGELTDEPVDDFTCHASIAMVGGSEFWASTKRHAEATARIKIRYRADINPQTISATHRIAAVEDYNASPEVTRLYDIKSVAIVGRRESIEFDVAEVV